MPPIANLSDGPSGLTHYPGVGLPEKYKNTFFLADFRGTAGNSGVAGFWMGLWHGLICVVTFVVSLFNPTVQIYEVHNNGAWYNFGFLLGASACMGGVGRGSARSSRP